MSNTSEHEHTIMNEIPRALVLGGKTGMLGQALMREGRQRKWQMVSLGREDGDICDVDFLEKQISLLNPDYIFNAVAYTAVDKAESAVSDAYRFNKTLPENITRIIRQSSCHCIHYSTDFVFNGKKTTPYVETDGTDPQSVYGSSKLAGEIAMLKIDNAAVLRTAWLFGAGRKNFVSTILTLAHQKDLLRVVHDQIGSPTGTSDLAEMSFLAAEQKGQGLFHAVNGGSASWCDLASESISLMNLSTFVEPIASNEWPQEAIRPAYSVLNTKHFSETFNMTPRPWPQALREYLFECMAEFEAR